MSASMSPAGATLGVARRGIRPRHRSGFSLSFPPTWLTMWHVLRYDLPARDWEGIFTVR